MEGVSTTTCPHRLRNSWMHLTVGAAQLPATLLVLRNLRTEELFMMPGWRVGASWILVTVSYSLTWLGGVVVGVLGKFIPDEYSIIPNL